MQLESDLQRGLTASLVAETLANYERADDPLQVGTENAERSNHAAHGYFFSDQDFWFDAGTLKTDARVETYDAIVTEWVPRVPGLYWQKGAVTRRMPRPEQVAEQLGDFVTLRPIGKSRVVSGGIGTLRLPPSQAGYRLCTLTTARNASSGVPFLISPETWDAAKLREGSVVSGVFKWRHLPIEWSSEFPSVAGLSRNCLVATRPEDLHVSEREAAVEVHPFAVMEYETDDATLHDFVFATAQTGDPGMRGAISTFFEEYRKADGRYGSYLTAGDTADPMWDATFASPEDLRRAEPATLRLIEARLNDVMIGKATVESAIRQLSRFQPPQLRRIAVASELKAGKIDFGGASAKIAPRVVDAAIERDRLPALLRIIDEETL